ncbi:MAG: hypothetical protein ACLUI3_08765 [Christensenellales bacterium]
MSEGQQSELLDMMAREAARLSTMDERLLLLTRLRHEQPEWTTFDSRAMARRRCACLTAFGRERARRSSANAS